MRASSDDNRPDTAPPTVVREDTIEYGFIGRLQGLKYEYRPEITDRNLMGVRVEKFSR